MACYLIIFLPLNKLLVCSALFLCYNIIVCVLKLDCKKREENLIHSSDKTSGNLYNDQWTHREIAHGKAYHCILP